MNSSSPIPVTSAASRGIGRFLAFAAAVILASIAVAQTGLYGLRVPGIDFYQFWVIGTELRYGNPGAIYEDSSRIELGRKWLQTAAADQSTRFFAAARRRQQLETFSTPLLYTLFALLSTGDYEWDYRCFLAMSLLISVGAIVSLCRTFQMPWITTCLWVAYFFGCFQPIRSDVAVGNVNQLQIGGLALYFWTQRHASGRLQAIAGGFVLGMMVAFKPNIAFAVGLLVLSWIVGAQWNKLIGQAAGFIAASVAAVLGSSLAFGSFQCWPDWLASMNELMSTQSLPIEAGNFSLTALIQHLGGHGHATALLALVSGLAAVIVATCSIGPRRDTEESQRYRDVMVFGIGTVAMLLGSKLAWVHYFELLIPAAIYCLMAGVLHGKSRPSRWADGVLTVTAVVLVSLLPFKWVFGFPNYAVPATLCVLGTIILAAQLVREIRTLDLVK